MNKLIITLAVSALAICTFAQERGEGGRRGRPRDRGGMRANPEAKLHRFSTTIEKERPQLNQETKDLIAAYRRNPSDENRAALRRQVAKNYDTIVARKKAKLEELKRTARHQSKIDEMQVIVDEMLRDREQRIEASMKRFTDRRMRPGLRGSKAEYLPLIGAAENVSIARFPVTNADYAEFVRATGRKPPRGWKGSASPEGKDRHPVLNVRSL